MKTPLPKKGIEKCCEKCDCWRTGIKDFRMENCGCDLCHSSTKENIDPEDYKGGICSKCGIDKGGEYGANGMGVRSHHTCSIKEKCNHEPYRNGNIPMILNGMMPCPDCPSPTTTSLREKLWKKWMESDAFNFREDTFDFFLSEFSTILNDLEKEVKDIKSSCACGNIENKMASEDVNIKRREVVAIIKSFNPKE